MLRHARSQGSSAQVADLPAAVNADTGPTWSVWCGREMGEADRQRLALQNDLNLVSQPFFSVCTTMKRALE
jgi:hypothetical protein